MRNSTQARDVVLDQLVFLRGASVRGVKQWRLDEQGKPKAEGYDTGPGPFEVVRVDVAGPAELAQLLSACPANAFMIRGATVDPAAAAIAYRQSRERRGAKARPATLKPAAHYVLPIDIDGRDPSIDGADFAASTAFALAQLPRSFTGAGCIAQATGSAGVKPGARIRLYFWADQPLSDEYVQLLLKDEIAQKLVDGSIYRPVQPIYLAAPTFEGVADPYAGRSRWAIVPGGVFQAPALAVPAPEPERVRVAREATLQDSQWADSALGAWELECATRDATPGLPARAWYNDAVFAIGTRSWLLPNAKERVAAGLHRFMDRRDALGQGTDVTRAELLERALQAFEDGCDQEWQPTVQPNTDAAEKELRKQAKRVKQDASLADSAIASLSTHLAVGAITPKQVATEISKAAGVDYTPEWIKEKAGGAAVAQPRTIALPFPLAAGMQLDEAGQPLNSPANLHLLLTHSESPMSLWRDSRSREDVWERCPWRAAGPVTDHDAVELRRFISAQLGWHKALLDPLAAISAAASLRQHDPWKAWLEGLQWDGHRRLARCVPRILHCEDNARHRLMFVWWMISAVARSFDPGCQVDHVLVLEGPQGEGKTSFFRELAMHPRFFARFAQSSRDLASPRAIGKLTGPVIVELAELAALVNHDMETVKAFIDEQIDRVQWLYTRVPVNVPRSFVFGATTNGSQYIPDTTGARRFWPVACGELDLQLLKACREQLWAEAVHLYRRGVRWYPKSKAQAVAIGLLAAQADRQTDQPFVEDLRTQLESPQRPGHNPLLNITWHEKQLDATCKPEYISTSQAAALVGARAADRMRVVSALRCLGWHRGPQLERGGTRFWKRGA